MESNLYKDEWSHSVQFHASPGHGVGGGGVEGYLAWLYYEVPHINHTLYFHISASILLSK